MKPNTLGEERICVELMTSDGILNQGVQRGLEMTTGPKILDDTRCATYE